MRVLLIEHAGALDGGEGLGVAAGIDQQRIGLDEGAVALALDDAIEIVERALRGDDVDSGRADLGFEDVAGLEIVAGLAAGAEPEARRLGEGG